MQQGIKSNTGFDLQLNWPEVQEIMTWNAGMNWPANGQTGLLPLIALYLVEGYILCWLVYTQRKYGEENEYIQVWKTVLA